MQLIKPLFHIQKTYVTEEAYQGAEFYYELYYRQGNQYINIGQACFYTIKAAEHYRDNILESLDY